VVRTEVLAQRTVRPGVVATVHERDGQLRYGVREPALHGVSERSTGCSHIRGAELRQPLTREIGIIVRTNILDYRYPDRYQERENWVRIRAQVSTVPACALPSSGGKFHQFPKYDRWIRLLKRSTTGSSWKLKTCSGSLVETVG
jgi:hypothetical protein